MALHIIVGDVTKDLSDYAHGIDRSSYLVDSSNIDNQHSGTVYVSLGDLSGLGQFYQFLCKANKITYYPPNRWSDKKTSNDIFSMAWYTEYYIRIAANLFSIETHNVPEPPVKLQQPVDQRKTDNPQIWAVGCSTTYGTGIERPEQRWANLVSEKTGLEMSLLARPGASNAWMADQLIRSDVRAGDTVIVGVTSYGRVTIVKGPKVINFVTTSFSKYPELAKDITPDQLVSDTTLYSSIAAIEQIRAFCRKVGAKLITIGIHADLELSATLSKEKDFIMFQGAAGIDFQEGWLDVSTDGTEHPGPKTHQLFADLILEKLDKS